MITTTKTKRLMATPVLLLILVMLSSMFTWVITGGEDVSATSSVPRPTEVVELYLDDDPAVRMYPNSEYINGYKPVQWFKFTAPDSDIYKFNMKGIVGHPFTLVFDSNMSLKGYGGKYMSMVLEKGKTYYIRVQEQDPGQFGNYDYLEISVDYDDYAIYTTKGDTTLFTSSLSDDDFYMSTGERMSFNVFLGTGYSCEWYRYDDREYYHCWANPYDIRRGNPLTSLHMTVDCPDIWAQYKLVILDAAGTEVTSMEFNITNVDVVTIDGARFSYNPVMVDLHSSYLISGEKYNGLSYEIANYVTVCSSELIRRFSNTDTYEIEDAKVFTCLRQHIGDLGSRLGANRLDLVFVNDPAKTETIAPDEQKTVSLGDQSSCEMGYYYDEKILAFTPEYDGTYTFSSCNLQYGNPEVALFDKNMELIDYVMPCMENDAVRYSFGDGIYTNTIDSLIGKIDTNGAIFWNEKNFLHTGNISLTVNLKGGETYYFAIPLYDMRTAAFDVRITADSQVIPDPDTPTPTNTNTPTPTKKPTAAPTGRPDSATPTARPTNRPGGATPTTRPGSSSPTPTRKPSANTVTPVPSGSSSRPASTPAPLPGGSELGIAEFVERLYSVALGRPSDPNGKADWINRVMTQGYTGADVAKGFLFSPEFLGMDMSNDEFVEVLYKTFFDRAGDPDGKADWLNRMANGWTKENVIMGFIDSTEWANLCMTYGIPSGGQGVPNITVRPSEGVWAFCTRLYTTCLNRDYDPNGLADWANRLANMQVTGTSAAWGFFFSGEFEAQNVSDEVFVTRLYRTFMGREPDAAGQADWMGRLASGASREEVFYGFANSDEFGQICMSYGIMR